MSAKSEALAPMSFELWRDLFDAWARQPLVTEEGMSNKEIDATLQRVEAEAGDRMLTQDGFDRLWNAAVTR